MSQDTKKNVCSVNLSEGMFGYLGNQPILKQGKKGLFTQFSLYNKYLPDGLNPIKVSVFGELAKKVCDNLQKKNSIRVVFDKMSFREIVNTHQGVTRPGIFITMKDYQLLEIPVQSEADTREAVAETKTSATDDPKVQEALAFLAKEGIKVAI